MKSSHASFLGVWSQSSDQVQFRESATLFDKNLSNRFLKMSDNEDDELPPPPPESDGEEDEGNNSNSPKSKSKASPVAVNAEEDGSDNDGEDDDDDEQDDEEGDDDENDEDGDSEEEEEILQSSKQKRKRSPKKQTKKRWLLYCILSHPFCISYNFRVSLIAASAGTIQATSFSTMRPMKTITTTKTSWKATTSQEESRCSTETNRLPLTPWRNATAPERLTWSAQQRISPPRSMRVPDKIRSGRRGTRVVRASLAPWAACSRRSSSNSLSCRV